MKGDKTFVGFFAPVSSIQRLDMIACSLGISRSEFVRRAIGSYLKELQEHKK